MEKIMTTQRIQLDVSSDIFDKVMFLLENLPKNKVKLKFENLLTSKKDENNLMFSDFLNNSQKVNSIKTFNRDALHDR